MNRRLSSSSQAEEKLDLNHSGTLATTAAFALWGVFPLYFKLLDQVAALEVLAHRVLWSVVFLALWLFLKQRQKILFWKSTTRRSLAGLILTAVLISCNWLVFIYAIVTQNTLDASLGYFINPVVIVALGVIFLKERLTSWQLAGLLFAVLGVGYQLYQLGELPWISLALAGSFGLYGILRKKISIPPVQGLYVETLLVSPLALIYLYYLQVNGSLVFGHQALTSFYLSLAGIITSIPLLLFAFGVRHISYTKVGFLQYIAPSLQFGIAVVVFDEPLHPDKLKSFLLVWFGLLLMSLGPRLFPAPSALSH